MKVGAASRNEKQGGDNRQRDGRALAEQPAAEADQVVRNLLCGLRF
jgi:hypothetical protein